MWDRVRLARAQTRTRDFGVEFVFSEVPERSIFGHWGVSPKPPKNAEECRIGDLCLRGERLVSSASFIQRDTVPLREKVGRDVADVDNE